MAGSTRGYISFSDLYPGTKRVKMKQAAAYIPAAAATDNTKAWPVFLVPPTHAVRVTKVEVVPQAAITGASTNSANWNLINKGTDGLGTTELANKDFVTGVNAAAFDVLVLYTPTTPAKLAAGTVLALQREKVGTGLALPEALVVVHYFDDLSALGDTDPE